MFENFWKHLNNASTHVQETYKNAQETGTNAVATACSLGKLGEVAVTSIVPYSTVSGSVCTAVGATGIVDSVAPILVTQVAYNTAKTIWGAVCKNPAAALTAAIGMSLIYNNDKVVETAKNLGKTLYATGKTIYEATCAVKDVVLAVGSVANDISAEAYSESKNLVKDIAAMIEENSKESSHWDFLFDVEAACALKDVTFLGSAASTIGSPDDFINPLD